MRVILVDDEQAARDRLRRLLRRNADLQFSGRRKTVSRAWNRAWNSSLTCFSLMCRCPGWMALN